MHSPADPQRQRRQQVLAEQVRAHYAQVPAMTIAPTLGGLFTAWVLWGAVDSRVLVLGMAAVIGLSATRLLLWRRFLRALARQPEAAAAPLWRRLAVGASLLSGLVWGSAAPLLYPPAQPGHEVFLLVLLTLLPVVPVAALAVYMPAFYAYCLPCVLPFVVTLALQPSWPAQMAALLLMMMLGALLTFARRYASSLAEAIGLRLALAEQSDALAAAVRHKSHFIAAASHDLRQPVHAMGMFLESLQQRGGDSGHDRVVSHLALSLRSLRGMLDNMLDLSRLDADAVRAQAQPLALAALLQRLADETAPLARQKGLQFAQRCDAVLVLADAALLERVLRNLLANALKYTASGGVALQARQRGSQVLLRVQDSGVGIRRQDFGRIFGEFIRLQPAGGDDGNGLGLGLAIVERATRLMGVALRLRSRPGRGSVFSLWLPLAPPGAMPGAAMPNGAAALPAAQALLPARLVLVIDDDPAVAAAAALLLQRWGLHSLVCHSAAQAMARLAAERLQPDLLLVDFHLAGGNDGLQAAALLRQQLGRPLPVILLTGDTDPARLREALRGGHVLLHKPVDPQRLRACLADLLAGGAPQPLPPATLAAL